MTTIIRTLIAERGRITYTAKLFGFHWALHVEPCVYAMANSLSSDYRGGYWDFYALSNGGFYLAPSGNDRYHVVCESGYEGELSADAFGITVCLYAYSRLSFSGTLIADACAQQYHWLREYALDHPQAKGIMAALD